jgi:hypothetical protein
MNYSRVGKNIYSYTKANGRKTYRARKWNAGKMVTKTFTSLKECKNWLNTNFSTPKATPRKRTPTRFMRTRTA